MTALDFGAVRLQCAHQTEMLENRRVKIVRDEPQVLRNTGHARPDVTQRPTHIGLDDRPLRLLQMAEVDGNARDLLARVIVQFSR